MISFRHATVLLLVFALGACEKTPAENPAPQDEATEATAATVAAPVVTAEEFISGLALDFPHQITNQRQVRQKGGGQADVLAIDFTEGSVRTVDRQLATALQASGFERTDQTTVPGGVRVAYVAEDGRRVSTMIRNKKYFGDRIAETSAGQISLSYVVE